MDEAAQAGAGGRLGVALLGTGFMGRAHSNAWRQVASFFDPPRVPVLELLCGRRRAAAADLAARFGWRRIETDWRRAVEDPAVDLVDIGLPNDLHAEPALAALAAGKHVACEKPLARDLAEARRMRDAARAAGAARSFVWFNYRRCPAVALARRLVTEGRLGRLLRVEARYLQSWGGADTPRSWRFERARAGSGALGDLAAHVVDLVRFVSGEEIGEVLGAAAHRLHDERPDPADPARRLPSDVDDAFHFLARLEGGALASFEASRIAAGHLNAASLEIGGEDGALRFELERMNRLFFFDGREPRATRGWREIVCTAAGEHAWVFAWWPEAHLLGYEHGFVNQAADILAVLGGGEPAVPLPDFEDAYLTQRVLEAAAVAAREHRPVATASLD